MNHNLRYALVGVYINRSGKARTSSGGVLSKGRRQLIGETVTRFVEEALRATIEAPTTTDRERRIRQLVTEPKFREHLGRVKKAVATTDVPVDLRMCEVIQAVNLLYRACGLEDSLSETSRMSAATLILNIFRQPDEDEIHQRKLQAVIELVQSFVAEQLTRPGRLPRHDEMVAEAETEVRHFVATLHNENLPPRTVAIQITCTVTWLLSRLKADQQLVQKNIITFTTEMEDLLRSRH